MNKNALILGIASAIVIVSCSAGGAILALNTSTSDENNKLQSKYEALQKEKTKLNGWHEESAGWYYYVDDIKQNNWVQDKNSWYYLASDGRMRTDWIQDKNKWYYLGSDGKMRTGWIKYNDKWYYLNNDGTMATNTTVDGNYINENGLIEETPKPKESSEGQVKSNKTKLSAIIIGKWHINDSNNYITITESTYCGEPYTIVSEEGNICTIDRGGEIYSIEVKDNNSIVTKLYNPYRKYYTTPYSCTRVY